jgi:hypothetical protein
MNTGRGREGRKVGILVGKGDLRSRVREEEAVWMGRG